MIPVSRFSKPNTPSTFWLTSKYALSHSHLNPFSFPFALFFFLPFLYSPPLTHSIPTSTNSIQCFISLLETKFQFTLNQLDFPNFHQLGTLENSSGLLIQHKVLIFRSFIICVFNSTWICIQVPSLFIYLGTVRNSLF